MMIGSGSMLWRCGVCNVQKPVGSGAICKRCKKFVCDRHIQIVLLEGEKLKVCTSCLKTDDKVKQGVIANLKKLFKCS